MKNMPHKLQSHLPKKRMEEIDILKALGIICVVVGHSGAPFTDFIYLFHMAIFFIASGFFYKDTNSDSIRSVAKCTLKKLKQLWLPFFLWTVAFVLLHNLFIYINIYTDNPELLNWVNGSLVHTINNYSMQDVFKNILKGSLFSCQEQLLGAFWFLKILFMISILYLFIDFLAKLIFKKHLIVVQLIVSIVFLATGFFCYLRGITALGFAQTFSFYCLYYIGHLLAECKEKYLNWDWKYYLPILVFAFCLLLLLNSIGSISLANNRYENPFYLLVSSLTGWMLLYSCSYFLKNITIVRNIMISIGRRTMSVLILHFLCFKIVEVVVIYYYGMPQFCLATFPNLYGNIGLWWLLYTIVGVGVPVLIDICYHFFINKCAKLLNLHNQIGKTL